MVTFLQSFILTFLFFFLCCCQVEAQSHSVSITVLEGGSMEPLEFVSVLVNRSGMLTDANGYARFEVIENEIKVTCSLVGFEDFKGTYYLSDLPDSSIQLVLQRSVRLLEEVSVVSSRYNRQLIREVASVEIVKPDMVKSNNITSLSTLMDMIPGVQIIDGQANIRGGAGFSYGAGSRVLLTVNDVPAIQADAGFPNWGDIPVENMAQVEVLKGAGSVLYGSIAMNGVINFRTAWAEGEPETKLTTQFTGFMTPRDHSKKWWSAMPFESNTNIIHKQRFKKWDGVFGGNYLHLDSYNKGHYDHNGRLYTFLRFHLAEGLNLHISALANKGKTDNFVYWADGKEGAYQGDTTTYSPNNKFRYYIDPVLTYYRDNATHKLIGRYFSVRNNVANNQSQFSDMKYLEYRNNFDFSDFNLILSSGLVYTGTDITAELYSDTTYRATNVAAYASLDKVFFEQLTVNAGARFEYNRLRSPEYVDGVHIPNGITEEVKPVFKLGLNYLVTRYSSFRASWGQGYRYPTVAEKFISTTAGVINVSPNPELLSETGWSMEVGFKQGLKIADWQGFVDAAWFRSDYDRMMEFTLLNISKGFQSFNIGNTTIQGIETGIQGQGDLGAVTLKTMFGYTYIDPKYRNFDEIDTLKSTVPYNILKYRMKHAIRANIGVVWRGIEIGGAYQYNSHMIAIDRIFDFAIKGVHDFREANPNGFHVVNCRIIAPLFEDKVSIGLYVNNIFNNEYSYRPGLLEAPRNIGTRISWIL